jgi:hypothetical protein
LAEQDPTLEGADNPERPEWLPENFKSPEALVDSYKELQGASTRTSQQLAEERQAREALEEAVQTLSAQFEAQNRPDPNQVYSQWQELFDNDPIGTMAQIAQATTQNLLQAQAQQPSPSATPDVVAFIADQTMGQSREDWHDYKEKVGELIAENPLFQRDELWTSPQAAAQALDSAYQMVKAQDVLSGNAVVQQQAADTRAMKLGAQSASGASGRSPAPDDNEQRWQEIMNAQSGKLGL